MSTAYDKHVEQALATHEGLSARELEATAAKLVNRRDGWREFGLFFSALADERRGHRAWVPASFPFPASTIASWSESRMLRHPSGRMCAMRWPSDIRNSPPPFRNRSGFRSRGGSSGT
jgi:hypothetical protein